jgi:tetratricopeptide (TPR) repeat protein
MENNLLRSFGVLIVLCILLQVNSLFAQYTPEQIFRKGYAALEEGSYEDAVNYFTQFLASYPENVRAFNYRGLAYESLKNYPSALSDFSYAVQLSHHYIPALLNRGSLYVLQQNYDDAISDFSNVIILDPSHIDGYLDRGTVYLKIEQPGPALSDLILL